MTIKVELLQATFQQVAPFGDAFAESFYERLFELAPSLKPMFAQTDMKTQHSKLIVSLVMVMENLKNPEVLASGLKKLGQRHLDWDVQPEHYALVGNALLDTFAVFLKEEWTPELHEAWSEAYAAIVGLMLAGQDVSQPV